MIQHDDKSCRKLINFRFQKKKFLPLRKGTTSAKRAQAIRMHNEATVRLKELRQIVQSEVIGSGQGTDEIIQLQGGGELHFVNTKNTRAYYLNHEESWLYLERENDGTSGTLYIVRRLQDGRLVTKTLHQLSHSKIFLDQ
ncbi:unnamed protein product [Brugia timori]|uniref:DUF3883 domain-containing protein n=1 Tax=Brugia timori TaxID=42155 RepID=A0A0R3R3G0_9BILA|nr:unnamed protein product [Brugia timori]